MKGYRGRKPIANIDRLIEILLRFSTLVADFPEISELDANPVLVRDDQVIVLDARVVVDRKQVEEPGSRPYAHLAIRPYPDELIERTRFGRRNADHLAADQAGGRDRFGTSCWPVARAQSLWERFRYMFKTDTTRLRSDSALSTTIAS